MSDAEVLSSEVENLKAKLASTSSELSSYKDEVGRLNDIINKLKRQAFGTKSERVEDLDPRQLVFNELEVESKNPEPPTASENISYTRKKPGRKSKPLPEELFREEVEIDIEDQDKVCPHDGTELKFIGFDEVEKLCTSPARSWVRVEKKKKYACPCCKTHMARAESNSILPGTIASPELLSFIIFSKFFQALPLYRLEELYQLQGIDLSRGRMASWMIDVSRKLIPVYNVLQEMAESTGYMQIDQTGVQVLREKGRRPESRSAMWVRGSPELGIALFEYDPSNAGYVANRILADYSQTVQSDAHGAFDQIDVGLQLGCMMHVRRRFFDAYEASKKGQGKAKEAIRIIKDIYQHEAAYKKQSLSAEDRHQARQVEVRPLFESLKLFCEQTKDKVPPLSLIGQAIHYCINQYDWLLNCLEDGRYEIDNGWCERAIRKFGIGRNNWLFSTSVDGADASATLYSLVVTAKLNGKDPFEAMTQVFEALPRAETVDDFEAIAKLLLRNQN